MSYFIDVYQFCAYVYQRRIIIYFRDTKLLLKCLNHVIKVRVNCSQYERYMKMNCKKWPMSDLNDGQVDLCAPACASYPSNTQQDSAVKWVFVQRAGVRVD